MSAEVLRKDIYVEFWNWVHYMARFQRRNEVSVSQQKIQSQNFMKRYVRKIKNNDYVLWTLDTLTWLVYYFLFSLAFLSKAKWKAASHRINELQIEIIQGAYFKWPKYCYLYTNNREESYEGSIVALRKDI